MLRNRNQFGFCNATFMSLLCKSRLKGEINLALLLSLRKVSYSKDLLCLLFLTSPLRFFDCNLFSFAAFVGLVFLRGLGFIRAFFTNATSRRIASSRFCSCVRNCLASMSKISSSVTRFPASRIKRDLTSSFKDEARTSNRNCAAVATLLTFCPPGPDARM